MLEKTLKSPTINLTPPNPSLNHIFDHHIHMSFKYLQGWWSHHFSGQPVPMLDNPYSEEMFPNTKSKPPMDHLEAVSSCPITHLLLSGRRDQHSPHYNLL